MRLPIPGDRGRIGGLSNAETRPVDPRPHAGFDGRRDGAAPTGERYDVFLTMLKCKLHMACVTQAELWYDGSCAIDSELVELAGLRENEKIDIYDVDNGERFSTYVILAEPGSRTISLNGAAARKVQIGDRIIIAAYASYSEEDLEKYEPRMVYLNADNSVDRTSNRVPVQLA